MAQKDINPRHKALCKALAMKEEEYWRLVRLLGREPTETELGMTAALWSEHCSYKSSRLHLRKFPRKSWRVLAGPGENAGAVDIGDGYAVVFKMESHNHPSFIEPFHGAATGVGGILRDIFAMGARPVALLDSLRFGNLDNSRMKYLVDGVVSGIAFYGNCVGVPTIGGETDFDPSYNGNILVNVMCVGVVKHERIQSARAEGPGNPVIYVGSKTGRDGIGGATMASEEFSDETEEKRPSVQIGDPFTEKLLIEACLEAYEKDLVVAVQDMGAAGLTSSSSEMAAKGGVGIELDLDRVPLREKGMNAVEIMISESQERMLIIGRKGEERRLIRLFKKWGLDAVVVGRVTDSGKIVVKHKGRVVADMPASILVDDAPLYRRPVKEPSYLHELREFDVFSLPEPRDLKNVFEKLLAWPGIASRQWVYRQYDHMVGTDTVVLPGSDAAVLRVKGIKQALGVTSDCTPRYCYLDPFTGGMQAVAEAARNLACVGAKPIGITDCLNFGNPEKPEVMWQFVKSIEGMSKALRYFQIPVVSGNVSFYNENEALGAAVHPTPTVGMVGIVEDVNKIVPAWFTEEEHAIILLGSPGEQLGGSLYLKVVHNLVAGEPPEVDLKAEKALQRTLRELLSRCLVSAVHDVSDGGLAIALAECSVASSDAVGFSVEVPVYLRADAALFGEVQARAVVACEPENTYDVMRIARKHGITARFLGTTGGRYLDFKGMFRISQKRARRIWAEAFERVLR